jgi:aspartyl-tRNA(Asn)/glutamyl-tRNA(Gln) amidotransferase subunit C
MKITEKEVRYVADLANLALTEEEIRRYCADLDEILVYVDKLNEVDTSRVEPMAQVLLEGSDPAATLRADEPRPSFPSEIALANAAQKGAGQFKVPKVVER